MVLLDQSSVFDTIDHDKLLDCLRKWFGVGGRCLDWFKSYLSDHTQCIKIGSVLSEVRKLKFGVPQGSVLGPILFSLYTTPLSKVISKHPDVKFHFYADDTQLFIHLKHKNTKIAFDRLGKCLEDVKLWLCANRLKLNADKSDFIIFGAKSQQEKLNPFFPVNILGESLIPSDAVKNLGVWFDSDFSFTKHVKNVCKLCVIQMRDLRGLPVANLCKLQCIQNSLARIVCRTTCLSHTTPLRKDIHWLPIRHRCIFKTALLVYKYLHTNCPKYFSPLLKVRRCAYNTRVSQSDGIILNVPQYQPSIYKSTKHFGLSFAYDAPKIWNELLMMYDLPLLLLPSEKNLRHTYSAKVILLSIFHLIWRSP